MVVDRIQGQPESEWTQTSRNDPGVSNTSSLGARASCLPAQESRHPLTLQLCPRGLVVMDAAPARLSRLILSRSAPSHSRAIKQCPRP